MEELHGKVAVVFGAGSGIGRATVHAFAQRGVRTVVADIDAGRSEQVAEEATRLGSASVPIQCDVRSCDDLESARGAAFETFAGVDIVMNNVGIIANGAPLEIPFEEWSNVIDINLLSIVRSNSVFLPGLLKQGAGHIVNTGSMNGLYPYAYDRLPYTASKAAIFAVSEALFLYTKPYGVGVSCLCPGPVRTNMGEWVRSFGTPTPVRGTALEFTEPVLAGERVVEAVQSGRFFVTTHDEIGPQMVEHAADPDAYLMKALDMLGRSDPDPR